MTLAGEQPVVDTGDEPICPQCGYDLREANDRCSECGWEIDWESLKHSGIPWAQRRKIGRFKAFVTTVWRMGFRPGGLQHEGSRPQDLRDGRRFAHVMGVLVALGLVAAFLLHVQLHKWESFELSNQMNWPRPPSYDLADLTPWSMGMLLRVPPLLGMALLAFFVVRAPARVVRMKGAPPARQERARAILFYCSAPLVLVPIAVALAWAGTLEPVDELVPSRLTIDSRGFQPVLVRLPAFLIVMYLIYRTRWRIRWILLALLAVIFSISALAWTTGGEPGGPKLKWPLIYACEAVLAAGLFLSAFRTMQWKMRLCHCGMGGAMLAGAELLLRWLAAIVLFLFVFPWCVGFVWIVIASLR